MGYYLGVNVVYGVAWGAGECPSACFPETEDGEDLVEDGEAVYGGRLVWGSHGMTLSAADRHLAVVLPYREGMYQGNYAERVPVHELAESQAVEGWDEWIMDYLSTLGVPAEKILAPGWLALGSFG